MKAVYKQSHLRPMHGGFLSNLSPSRQPELVCARCGRPCLHRALIIRKPPPHSLKLLFDLADARVHGERCAALFAAAVAAACERLGLDELRRQLRELAEQDATLRTRLLERAPALEHEHEHDAARLCIREHTRSRRAHRHSQMLGMAVGL
eukprot:6204049-Pleurochrysis_carterae.AAC.1